MTKPTPCDHDKRFAGVFDLPKGTNGCLACAYEKSIRDLAAAQEELERVRDKCNEHYLGLAARDESLHYVRETLDKARPGMDEGAPIEAIARKVAAYITARDAELAAERERREKVREECGIWKQRAEAAGREAEEAAKGEA